MTDTTKAVFYAGPYEIIGNEAVHRVRNFSSATLNQTFYRQVEMPDASSLKLVGPFGNGGKAVISWKRRD
jgi:hypothetical protein